MADRRVSVSLNADISRFQRALATAAAEAKAFGRSMDGLNGPITKTEQRAKSAGKEIDQFSGRLRTLADAAVTLGPALVPLGAATIPAVTAALSGLGAAAGAIGTTILAFHGLGDAIKAIDAYRLQPTVENLQKMRIEQEKLGPAGAQFSRFIANLEPELRDLQNTARAGLFPGLEDGIDAFLTRGPQVEKIINRLSKGMGEIAQSAGEALASDEWTPFFNYIETDARPTLDAFAQATGNVALGVANMIVAFAPLSRDFTSSLVGATNAFEKWSEGLADNQSFQDFVDYVRTSGPQAAAFLGAIGKAMVGLLQAAAPMGQVVLPALTSLAKVFATIASSPIGPPLYAAAAGMIAFSRATKIAEFATGRFNTAYEKIGRAGLAARAGAGVALLALSQQDLTDKIGLSNTAMDSMAGLMVGGPWGLAIGGGIGLVQDLAAANDDLEAAVSGANQAMADGSMKEMRQSAQDLRDEIQKTKDTLDSFNFGGEHDGPLGQLKDAFDVLGVAFTGGTAEAEQKLAELKVSLHEGGDAADLFGETIGRTGDQMRTAAGGAEALAGALAHLNGWFDKREAVRNYKDAIDGLHKSLKDGFSRDDAANVDAIGRSILQVAQNIKNPGARATFLEQARAQLEDMAQHSGPKAAAAIQEVIDKFDDQGLTNPPPTEMSVDDRRAQVTIKKNKQDLLVMGRSVTKPTIDADDNPFRQTYGTVKSAMAQADRLRARPKIDADASAATGVIDAVKHMLSALDGTTATTYVRTVRNDIPLPGRSADGGSVPKDGGPYSDRFMYLLAPGEEVISNRHGEADRYRARIKGRYADGGTTGGHFTLSANASQGGVGDQMFTSGAYSVAKALKALQAALARSEKALDKERQSRDDLQSQYDSIKSTVGSAYSSMDPFAASTSVWSQSNPLGMFDSALASNTANTQAAQTALAFAQSHGLDGPLYAALAASGNLPLLQAFANLSSAEIDQREKAFAAQSNAQAALGGMAANAQVGAQLADANHHLNKLRDEVRELRRDVRQADQNNQKAQDKNAKDVKDGVNGAAAHGHKRGRH